MVRLPFLVAVVTASIGCGASTSSQEAEPGGPKTAATASPDAPAGTPAAIAVPENPADKGIRRELNLALSRDEALKHRDISFIVSNGDVSVTGRVRTEEERKRINELALNIGGVKSVANAVLIAE